MQQWTQIQTVLRRVVASRIELRCTTWGRVLQSNISDFPVDGGNRWRRRIPAALMKKGYA